MMDDKRDIESVSVGGGSIEAGLRKLIGADIENGANVVRRSWILSVEEARRLVKERPLTP